MHCDTISKLFINHMEKCLYQLLALPQSDNTSHIVTHARATRKKALMQGYLYLHWQKEGTCEVNFGVRIRGDTLTLLATKYRLPGHGRIIMKNVYSHHCYDIRPHLLTDVLSKIYVRWIDFQLGIFVSVNMVITSICGVLRWLLPHRELATFELVLIYRRMNLHCSLCKIVNAM